MNQIYKISDPQKVSERLKKTTDKLGMPIDKGIFRSVVILNSLGFETTGSCEGHIEEINKNPWIQISFHDENTNDVKDGEKLFFDTLLKDIEDFYSKRDTKHENVLTFKEIKSSRFLIDIYPNTNLLVFSNDKFKNLKDSLNEINDFCEFLNLKYKLNF